MNNPQVSSIIFNSLSSNIYTNPNNKDANHKRVLILDASGKPFTTVPTKEAIVNIAMQMTGDDRYPLNIIKQSEEKWHSKHLIINTPLIAQLENYIHTMEDARRFQVRRDILFYRDLFTCQYCGEVFSKSKGRKLLTIDHIIPACLFKTRKEATYWENITTACKTCNAKKADKLPNKCGMHPAQKARTPHLAQLLFAGKLNYIQQGFIRDYYDLGGENIAL